MSKSFIRAYGLHWFRDEVDWRSNGQLYGRQNVNVNALRLADMWRQTGIYILHDAYGAYYVGQVEKQPLGERLRQHTKDSHEDKWDRFSWFGFNAMLTRKTKDGVHLVKDTRPKDLLGSTERTIHDVEALLIMTLGSHRTGNMHTEKFTDAQEWVQVWDHEKDKHLAVAQRQADSKTGPMFR